MAEMKYDELEKIIFDIQITVRYIYQSLYDHNYQMITFRMMVLILLKMM